MGAGESVGDARAQDAGDRRSFVHDAQEILAGDLQESACACRRDRCGARDPLQEPDLSEVVSGAQDPYRSLACPFSDRENVQGAGEHDVKVVRLVPSSQTATVSSRPASSRSRSAATRYETLRAIARLFVTFAAEDQARYELLFERTIPDFKPSTESYAVAVEVFTKGRAALSAAGLTDDVDFDLWTALVAGLARQQLANDPGGDRYMRLIDDAVEMFVKHVFDKHALDQG
jgi:hypothetical protein